MIKIAPFFRSEFQVYRSQILFQTFQLGCARDGNDPRFLSKQPCKRNLGGGRSFPLAECIEQIDENPVRFIASAVKRGKVARLSLLLSNCVSSFKVPVR